VQVVYAPAVSLSPWIGFGPYGALLVSGHYKSSSGKFDVPIGNEENDAFKPFDFGVSFTAGLRLNNRFLFGIDQHTGLVDVTPGQGKSRNLSWNFFIGYIIK